MKTCTQAADAIEVLGSALDARGARAALFDFDGTLSLIRSGWVNVMVPMMVEILLELKTGESEEEIRTIVRDWVDRLTGKQTIYQMIELARQIQLRGGEPEDPLYYKRRYLDLLHCKIADRLNDLRSGNVSPEKHLVPGSRALLTSLRERGLTLYLASGTDQELVREEAQLLDIDKYFDGGVYGALDEYKSFSKKLLIQQLLTQPRLASTTILGFGDGYVEIENVKEVNGVAIGVATDEPHCRSIDEWKRGRLASAGADIIVANFECRAALFQLIFPQ